MAAERSVNAYNLIPPQSQQTSDAMSPYVLGMQREGNPLSAGYLGYSGAGQSPLTFSYGPYGFGSYGFDPGQAQMGFSNPIPAKTFDTARGEIWQPKQ
jgi:hypothetical protein